MSDLTIGLLLKLITNEDIDLAGAVLAPMLRGFLKGLLLAVVAYLLLKVTKLIRMDTTPIARIAVTLWLVILLPIFFVAQGFYSGLNRATQSLLTETDLVNTTAPGVGEEIAAFVLELDSRLREMSGLPEGDGDSLDMVQFTALCQTQADEALSGLLTQISDDLKRDSLLISSGLGASIFDWFVDRFGKALITQRLDRTGIIGEWFHGLSRTAEKMDKKTLADYSANTLVRGVVTRLFAILDRIQRAGSRVLLFSIFMIPAVALWLSNRNRTKKLLEAY